MSVIWFMMLMSLIYACKLFFLNFTSCLLWDIPKASMSAKVTYDVCLPQRRVQVVKLSTWAKTKIKKEERTYITTKAALNVIKVIVLKISLSSAKHSAYISFQLFYFKESRFLCGILRILLKIPSHTGAFLIVVLKMRITLSDKERLNM